ncbi:hypothetical protein GSI_08485 [Ganoderma sinense ZZ0214-1]|uniref:Uncharacterized protein n=1 Tax=Ganoderma sinense ZZ0214-1 TaxID=1077348 RepID=A0A2G8S3W3_9APHY|nr:hypothetical protein GSI_08485 [Ganoderma sinense ZZ0214-1]
MRRGSRNMPSRQEQVGLRQVTHRVRSTPSISSSPTVTSGEYGPILLNVPTSLTESIPSNITWTGGVAPYTLLVKLGSSSDVLQEFDGINATHFLWTPDVPAETFVSLQIVDARTVLTYTEDPILVGAGMDLTWFAPNVLNGTVSVSIPRSTFTSTFVTSVRSTTPSPSPSFPSDVQVAPQHNTVSGSTIAVTVIGIMIFLVLATFPWWRSRVRTRRRANRRVDTEKQEVVEGGDGGRQIEVRSDAGSMATIHTDPPVIAPSMNPFEDPENILYAEEIFAASPVSDLDDTTPTRDRSPFIGALPTSPRPANVVVPARSLTLKVGPRSRPPSMSGQSDPSYTRQLSNAEAARLSISTSSTLPPSYRTRSSVGSHIQIPSPSYPAFPPPVYTPTVTETDMPPLPPPSEFRPPVSRRAPQRRVPAPTPSKVLVLDPQNSGEGESESAYADGMWADSPRDRDPVAVESPGSLSGTEDAASEAAANPFADGRGIPSDDSCGDSVVVGMATRDIERTRTY